MQVTNTNTHSHVPETQSPSMQYCHNDPVLSTVQARLWLTSLQAPRHVCLRPSMVEGQLCTVYLVQLLLGICVMLGIYGVEIVGLHQFRHVHWLYHSLPRRV